MSVSLFGFEKSKQNKFLEELHYELANEVKGNTFQDNLQRSKLRLLKMMQFCRENYELEGGKSAGGLEDESAIKKAGVPKYLQNFDKIRQQMKQKIMHVPQKDEKMNVIIENDDEKEEFENGEDQGSLVSSKNKNDSLRGLTKPSSLNVRSIKAKNRDSIAVNNSNKRKFKNQALENIRHRNSEFIRDSDVRTKTGPGLSKFGQKQSNLTKQATFGYEAELNLDDDKKFKQRDSIDVSYIKNTANKVGRPSTLAEIRNSMF